MNSDPSPFIQAEWMHLVAPILLGASIAFVLGFLIYGFIAGNCRQSREDKAEIDALSESFAKWGDGYDG